MPKPISIPPNLKEIIDTGADAKVEITETRIMRDVMTSIGMTKLAVGITVICKDEEYSQMFSLDKEILTGSIGRLLVAAGVEEITGKNAEEEAAKLLKMKVTVKNRGGKLYWYP